MVMTFILVTSSLTMLIGDSGGAKAGDKAGAFRWTMITASRAEFCLRFCTFANGWA